MVAIGQSFPGKRFVSKFHVTVDFLNVERPFILRQVINPLKLNLHQDVVDLFQGVILFITPLNGE